jgi:hypothetical protein
MAQAKPHWRRVRIRARSVLPVEHCPPICNATLPNRYNLGRLISWAHSQRLGLNKATKPVKMIAEYLEHAVQFDLLARTEKNPKLKADFESQAAAYRKLAAERSKKLGLEPPPGTQ